MAPSTCCPVVLWVGPKWLGLRREALKEGDLLALSETPVLPGMARTQHKVSRSDSGGARASCLEFGAPAGSTTSEPYPSQGDPCFAGGGLFLGVPKTDFRQTAENEQQMKIQLWSLEPPPAAAPRTAGFSKPSLGAASQVHARQGREEARLPSGGWSRPRHLLPSSGHNRVAENLQEVSFQKTNTRGPLDFSIRRLRNIFHPDS